VGQAPAVSIEEKVPWLVGASRRMRWLAGVSGGADSVALLHLLHGAGFRDVVVCHLDHGLRGRASAGDAKFVEKLAAQLGYRAEIGREDVKGLMKAGGASLETAARQARHGFFAECSRRHRCRRLLLAHHLDDQAETVLWNLLRGSHGLKGMRERRELGMGAVAMEIFRPLLTVRHEELVGWLKERGLGWREDASNAEPLAVRNRLRNEALPLLAEITGRDVAGALAKGAADALEQEEVVAWALRVARVCDPQGRLHVAVLRGLPGALQRAAVAEFLKAAGVGDLRRGLMDEALGLLLPDAPPAVNLPGGGWLRRRAGRIFLQEGKRGRY
jgi:tRNA(Ile)-lysidine synthase